MELGVFVYVFGHYVCMTPVQLSSQPLRAPQSLPRSSLSSDLSPPPQNGGDEGQRCDQSRALPGEIGAAPHSPDWI